MTTKARIRLTGREIDLLNDICNKIKDIASDSKVKFSGPISLPTKKLKVTTRKSTDGEGTATFDRWEMRIHKRLMDVEPNERVMRQIMRIPIPDAVDIEIQVKT